MNLTTLPSLVRRIRSLAKANQPNPQGARLAQEFAGLCQLVNQRLAQCEVMLSRGNEGQALQLAGAPPSLMELLTQVGFRELATWRDLCQRQQWPIPPLPDLVIIRRLNELFAKTGSDAQPPHKPELVAAYRAALLRGDDEAARPALRLLAQLDPGDTEIRENLDRVEGRMLRDRLDDLATCLADGDADRVLTKLDEIEAMALPRPARKGQVTVWHQAQLLRVRRLLDALQPLHDADDWASTLELVRQLQDLCAAHGLVLPAPEANTLAQHESWAATERATFEQAQLEAQTLQELEFLIEQCEQKRFALRQSSLTTLRSETEVLRRKWAEATQGQSDIPPGLEARYQQLIRVLTAEIAARSSRRRTRLLAAAGSIAVLLLGGILLLRGQWEIHRASRALHAAIASQLPVTASNQVAHARQTWSTRLHAPPLERAVAAAQEYYQQAFAAAAMNRQALLSLTDQWRGLSPDAPFPELVRLQALTDDLEREILALSPELQPPLLAEFQESSTHWDTLLRQSQAQRQARFRQALADAAAIAGTELVYNRGLDPVLDTLDRLTPILERLQSETNPPVPALALSPELVLEFDTLAARSKEFAETAQQWRLTTHRLLTAPDCGTFTASLSVLLTNGFASATQRAAIETVLLADPTTNRLHSRILGFTPGEAWPAFLQSPTLRLAPTTLSADEEPLLHALEEDVLIHEVKRYRLHTTLGERSHLVYVNLSGQGILSDTNKGVVTASVYDPTLTPHEWFWETKTLEHWRLVPDTTPGFIPETVIYRNCGLPEAQTDNLLEVLDGVRHRFTGTNGLIFRAFLFQRLAAVTDHRPLEWGTIWAPALRDHRSALRQLSNGEIRRGDWLVPTKIQTYAPVLEAFFQETTPISYTRQARFFHQLAVETAAAPWTLVGYVDPDTRQPVAGPAADRHDLYGWDRESRLPARLFRWSTDRGHHELVREPLPFTPLYALGESPPDILQRVQSTILIKADDPSIKPWLPPLFAHP